MEDKYKVLIGILLVCWLLILGLIYGATNREVQSLRENRLDSDTSFAERALFNAFSCEIPTGISDDPILQVVRSSLYGIPSSYEPENLVIVPPEYVNGGVAYLREDILEPFIQLMDDARAEGHNLKLNSGYRSFERQENIFTHPANAPAIGEFDRAAQPGFSEHQLGTVIDVSAPLVGSANTLQAGYDWLEQNGYKYGFIISYPRGQEAVTGFRHEPWHHRYVGVELAEEFKDKSHLFNQGEDAFMKHPQEETIVKHAFLGDSVYVSLRSGDEMRNDVLYYNFVGNILSEAEIDEILLKLTRNDPALLVRPEGNIEFTVIKNPLEHDFTEYNRTQARASLGEDKQVFVDIIEMPHLNAFLLFAYSGRLDQTNTLQNFVLDNCR